VAFFPFQWQTDNKFLLHSEALKNLVSQEVLRENLCEIAKGEVQQ